MHPSSRQWGTVNAQGTKAHHGYGTGAWEPLRRAVLARDGGVCQAKMLSRPVSVFDRPGQNTAAEILGSAMMPPFFMICGQPATHVDHIVPKAKGGTDDLSNLRALCSSCHKAKTARRV